MARALAEKERKEQAKREAEAEQPSEPNAAPLVPGVWEEDVMGRGKSHFGTWIFLSIMALAFVTGMLLLLYKPSSDLFDREDDDTEEVRQRPSAPAKVPAKAPATQSPTPAHQPDTYYVVAGVFNFKDNADMVSQKLHNTKKLKSDVVQLHDGKFAVCLSRHDSETAALRSVDRYKKQHINVWVVR